MIRNNRAAFWIAVTALCGTAATATAQDCSQTFDNTYDLIQAAVFERRGCTDNACHGTAASGDLVLTADVSYDNLVEQESTTVFDGGIPNLKRVVPGQKDQSLLFLNLAAATLPDQWDAPLRAMPLGIEPLSINELEAVREWIEAGAPRTGTVPGTAELLDACLPPAKPIEITPLDPPAPGTGLQLKMPKWVLDAKTEDEVCFTSYYDVTDQVPEEYRVGDTFVYDLNQIRQDPLSHHLIVNIYTGTAAPDDPRWGPYRCRGGEKDGQTCVPTDLEFCGENSLCGSDPVSGAVCTGYGPPDAQTASFPFSGIQEASAQQEFPPGAYRPVPLKGLIIWNSHAFNLTDEPGKIEAWLNYKFAEPEDRQFALNGIFNTSRIFSMNVPAFEAQEICQHNVFPQHARLYQLNSHTHQRGKLFRVFDGSYSCAGGANAGRPCSPLSDESMETDMCPGSECVAVKATESADCDLDGFLRVNDLITCVNISLALDDLSSCPNADPNSDGKVSIAELVTFVNDSFEAPEYRNPEEDLLYTNLVYNDPTVVTFDPPKPMEGSPLDRTVTYCSLYDNGFSDPSEVKNRTTSPESAGFLGGPCETPTGCTEGKVGAKCSGSTDEERNASCDSSEGAGDGFCDACQLRGGFTTEDEMFILMGSFYVDRN
jgi:hypothetical protein